MARGKDILTTGEVAKACNVASRTVAKWVDTGRLRGYRLPGTKDRRIPLQQLVRFMKAHGMPLDRLQMGNRILIVDHKNSQYEALADDYEVRYTESPWEAGILLGTWNPDVLIVNFKLVGILEGHVLSLRKHDVMAEIRVIATSASEQEGAMRSRGFDIFLDAETLTGKKLLEQVSVALQNGEPI